MTTDLERAHTAAWQCLADSCTEHDQCHEQRALAELTRLGALVPPPREPDIADCE